ncbi:MAG: NfeD family protein [Bacilli bacterium]
MDTSVWLLIIGVLLILIDFATGTLSLLFIGISMLIAYIVYYFTSNVFVTFITFIVLSLVSLVIASMLKRKMGQTVESGVYRLVGQQFKVKEVNDADYYSGTISVNGEVWNIMSSNPLEEEMLVEIESVSGATFYVKTIDERNEI